MNASSSISASGRELRPLGRKSSTPLCTNFAIAKFVQYGNLLRRPSILRLTQYRILSLSKDGSTSLTILSLSKDSINSGRRPKAQPKDGGCRFNVLADTHTPIYLTSRGKDKVPRACSLGEAGPRGSIFVENGLCPCSSSTILKQVSVTILINKKPIYHFHFCCTW